MFGPRHHSRNCNLVRVAGAYPALDHQVAAERCPLLTPTTIGAHCVPGFQVDSTLRAASAIDESSKAHACKSLNPGCSGGRWASQHVSLPGSGTVNVARRNWSSRNRNSSVLRAFSSSSHSIQFSRYNSLRRHALHLRNVANLPSHNCQKPGVGLQLGSSPILARSTKFCTAVFDATCSFAAARVRV